MVASWQILTLSSLVESVVLVHLAPQYATSYVRTFSALLPLHLFALAFYHIIIYPNFLSPLRHLPQPKVGVLRLRYGQHLADRFGVIRTIPSGTANSREFSKNPGGSRNWNG